MNLPPDFNWQTYIELNEDIKNNPIYCNEFGAKNHWIKYGRKEGRKYKYEEISPIILNKKEILPTTFFENPIIINTNNEKLLTIIVPNKNGQTPIITITSLYNQTFKNFDIIIINDFDNNANKARNRGLKLVNTPYVLFSDNDIEWETDALESMYNCLESNPEVSFAYGHAIINNKISCNKEWNLSKLYQHNYISTMSMVRTKDHPGFDENIKRLQDWDVWLTMASQNKIGKYINKKIFSTIYHNNGITNDSVLTYHDAVDIIKEKHNLSEKKKH